MTRTLRQLIEAALARRRTAVDADLPLPADFPCTFEERLVIFDAPRTDETQVFLTEARDAICGMRLKITG